MHYFFSGEEFGIRNCGYFAMRALRLEKFYAFWGQDIDSYTTPVECGRNFRTKLGKNIDFIGREAIERQELEGVKKTLVLFILDDIDYVWVHHMFSRILNFLLLGEMVFCYHNCSDLLWEKIVLVNEKNFWNSRLKAENLQNFWDH